MKKSFGLVTSMLTVALMACGNSGNSDSVVIATSVPTATSDVAETTTSKAPATTVAPPPSTAALTTAPPTTAPAPTALQVSGNRVGEFDFGTDSDRVISGLQARFGSPTEDSGWQRFLSTAELSEPEYGEAGKFYEDDDHLGASWRYRSHRRVCWKTLCLEFGGNSEGNGELRGWDLSLPYDQSASPADLDVEIAGSGIRLGSTWGQVQAAYPGLTVSGGEGGSLTIMDPPFPGFFDGAGVWRLTGRSDSANPNSAPPSSTISRLTGGEGPEPGCC